MTDANVVDGLREAAEFYTKRPTIDEQIYVPSSIEMTRQEALELAMTLKTAHSLIISLQLALAEALRLRDIAQENAALWDKRRMEAVDERDEAVAQQAAMVEALGQTATMLETYAPEIFPDINEQGQKDFGRVMMESAAESIRNSLSSLSPRAKAMMEELAALRNVATIAKALNNGAKSLAVANALAKLAETEHG